MVIRKLNLLSYVDQFYILWQFLLKRDMFVNELIMRLSNHVIVCQHAVLRELANRIVSVITITTYLIIEALIALLNIVWNSTQDIRVAARTRSSKLNLLVIYYVL